MEKQTFAISINAPREKVWNVLWDDATYPAWTAAFHEGSRAVTDWQKGSKVLFTDGSGQGMTSMIADNIPNEFMSIKHLGFIKDGVEDTTSDEVQPWVDAMENYRLIAVDGHTELVVEMDITDAYKDYFATTWPKALENVKALSEKS